jgi:hypothetical protein
MLILLDNCEHVVDAAAQLVAELLARCPGVTVLATSREPLGVPGELLRPVEPLPEPVALRLLTDRGAAARPGFRVEDDPEAAAEICRRLDGLPLAIELAAARLRMLSLRQIADRLDDRFRLLTSGSRTVLPRQQTLRAVVDWSWDLLDTDERDVLRRLSVFAGGCDLPAAEAVCGPVAFEALGSLVDKSLVVAAPSDDNTTMRYRLLETVVEYAGERLDETGVRYEYLDGQTSDRQTPVQRFQSDPDCRLFLISLKAGGVGLNLTAAEYVFLLDPWWNPAAEAQAIDRSHRIGQTKPVFAYRLIARNTVEEKVLALQETKRALADAILGGEGGLIGELKREDLELLLS